MTKTNDIADGLLASLPNPTELAKFRSNIASSIEKNHVRVQRERVITTVFWIFCATSATVYLWFGSGAGQFPRAPFLACIFFLWGGIEVLKHQIQAARIEALKEIKQLQLQVLELQAQMPPQKC